VDQAAITSIARRFDASQGPRIVGADDGPVARLGGCDARFLIWGEESGGGFSLVEHPIPPRSLCAPFHRHLGIDEYSFVLEGRMGALLGDEVVYAEAGELAFKPRDQWHTFWNAGDEPCRILEIISPAGFERFFRELSDMGGVLKADPEAVGQLSERYGLEMQPETVPELIERFGLQLGEPLSGGWTPPAL
jgi:mannose-6-phosphate isomerase-like protein (cupin superfamily)